MATTEANNRVELVFSLFDANGNGVLDPGDFELMGRRVVEAVPEAGDGAKHRMLKAFQSYWDTLRTELDADGDGQVSPAEFNAIVLDPQRFDVTVNEFAEALAALGDPDGDGYVERPHFVALMTAIGFQRPNIEALFDAFEPVHGDRVPVVTWADGIRDYYRPEKSGIPGDHLTTGTDQ
ncbi:EF-hand domain-containing protein [Streptomyces sp. AM6-12]|uniref:EF-hand domain-containing protein n=1 Tax=Streptomyces sp. AM6-12 TaxID=3345149 RepID=UPI0037BB559F